MNGCFSLSSTSGLMSDSSRSLPMRCSSARWLGLHLRAETRSWTHLLLRPQHSRLERETEVLHMMRLQSVSSCSTVQLLFECCSVKGAGPFGTCMTNNNSPNSNLQQCLDCAKRASESTAKLLQSLISNVVVWEIHLADDALVRCQCLCQLSTALVSEAALTQAEMGGNKNRFFFFFLSFILTYMLTIVWHRATPRKWPTWFFWDGCRDCTPGWMKYDRLPGLQGCSGWCRDLLARLLASQF